MAMMTGVDLLRHLTFFVTVADVRHFGHAADDLQMTQPPLSQGIQRLERQLGLRLFERGPGGVSLTAAGSELLPLARRALESADSWSRAAAEVARRTQPVLVGVPVGLGALSARLVDGIRSATSLPVVPTTAGSTELVERTATAELDLAVVRHPLVVDGTQPGEIVTLATYLLTSGAEGGTLPDLPFVVPPRQHHPPAHDQFVDSLRRTGHSGATISADSSETITAWVAAGAAVAVTADRRPPAPLQAVPLLGDVAPLRLRLVVHPVRRRTDVDLSALVAAAEATLRAEA